MANESLDAATLRSMGIDHERLADDAELVATVELLRDLGITLDEMVDTDLTFLAGPKAIRPDATIRPDEVFDFDNDVEFARNMVLALGFNFGHDDLLLTPAEVATIRFFDAQRAVFGDDDTLALIQVMGTSMARIARSVVSMLRMRLEIPIFDETGSIVEVTRAYQETVREQLPSFIDAVGATLRRHLALLSGPSPLWSIETSEAATMEFAVVGFVDMVGFTSFTEQAGQAALVETVRTFERRVNAIVVGNGGVLVKLIGDEAMFVAADITSALHIATELCCLPLDERGPSSVRVGLASGEVAAIDGDYFGTVVNLAARAVQVAEPDSILVTDDVHAAADGTWTFLGSKTHELKGISSPVVLWELATIRAG